ncbi:nitrile hydratase subunit beta [Roseovarius spongiae]|uniref:Nitrile hydratase subunit beta n=1 Tax=Roseovarius spongiae TaxID=2320272 RepID=A0A3A8B6W8_9RHOB|nr:nitrile hydratase subunit beta [Roseovarius spongiae]RKF17095.1 nitrile hydratase subunit beta [Roseovarius spongiae]
MDGIHDMGGMHGFGRVPVEAEEVFTHEWQRRSFALADALAWTVPFNADQHRHAIERLAPGDYLTIDYFEKWARACQMLMQEAGVASAEELATGRKSFDPDLGEHGKPPDAATVRRVMPRGAQLMFPPDTAEPAFRVGQRVRVRDMHVPGHTRAPRYVRLREGVIERDLGVFQFADAMARGDGPDPQHCYTVAFAAQDLWGAEAEPRGRVFLDLWEAYLDPA